MQFWMWGQCVLLKQVKVTANPFPRGGNWAEKLLPPPFMGEVAERSEVG